MERSPASPRKGTRHQKIAPLTTLLLILKWRSLARRTHTCHLLGARPAPSSLPASAGGASPLPGCFRSRRAAAAPRRGAGRGRRHARRPAPPGTQARSPRRKISFHPPPDAPLRGGFPSRRVPALPSRPGRLPPRPPHHAGMSGVPGAAPAPRPGLPSPRPGKAQG